MKKFIIFIITAIMLMFAANVSAIGQTIPKGTWFTIELEGDELLGNSDDIVTSYITSRGDNIFTYSENPTYFIVELGNGIFDFNVHSSGYLSSHTYESVIIGYYNANGELVDKENTILSELGNELSNGVFSSEKMYEYIRNSEGYIRIVADKYSGSNFDEKIPTWKTTPPIRVNKK